jgi:hypothetical protein
VQKAAIASQALCGCQEIEQELSRHQLAQDLSKERDSASTRVHVPDPQSGDRPRSSAILPHVIGRCTTLVQRSRGERVEFRVRKLVQPLDIVLPLERSVKLGIALDNRRDKVSYR